MMDHDILNTVGARNAPEHPPSTPHRLRLLALQVLVSTLTFLAPTVAVHAAESGTFSTGDAPRYPVPRSLAGTSTVQIEAFSVPAAKLSAAVPQVDTQDRNAVVAHYHSVYQASEDFENHIGWTGDINSCAAGTVSDALQIDTLRRINYFRSMAGVAGDIVFDPVKNAKSQQAALMMVANGALSHFPPENWRCYSADGAEAAKSGNISLGSSQYYMGPRAVDGLMEDDGSNNAPVGHRRWLLYPPAREMGNGSIPLEDGQFYSGNAVWVIGDFGPRPSDPEWVSWPNAGNIPYQLVPQRWSFSYPNASFRDATVSMRANGNDVPVVLEPYEPFIGDNTLVWIPNGLPTGQPQQDTTYSVTIAGVVVNGQTRTFNYDVVVMDPYQLGEETQIVGPAQILNGVPALFHLNPIDHADAYNVRVSQLANGDWLEGGEQGLINLVDDTHPSYDLVSSALSYSGNASLHLTFPDLAADNGESFTLDRIILPSATSHLQFFHRFRFVSTFSTLRAEVSIDGGVSWEEIWNRSGSSDHFESASEFSAEDIPLPAHLAGLPTRIRFHFTQSGPYYIGTEDYRGLYIDNIQVTDSQELQQHIEIPVTNGTEFNFQPPSTAIWQLQGQTQLGGHWFPFGPITQVASLDVINRPPTPLPDSISVSEGGTATILESGAASVLGNDSDPDGDSLTAIQDSPPQHGTLTLRSDGTLSYVHNGDEQPQDSFDYLANDSALSSDPVTVTIHVTPVNDPPLITAQEPLQATAGIPLTVSLADISVSDPDNSYPSGFSLALSDGPDYQLTDSTVTPSPGFSGTLSIPTMVNDGALDSPVYLLQIAVSAPNNLPPTARDDTARLPANGSLFTNAPGLLGNDDDPDGDLLSVDSLPASGPSHGALQLNPDGSWSYTPSADFIGQDRFTYQIQDGNGGTAQAQVDIDVLPSVRLLPGLNLIGLAIDLQQIPDTWSLLAHLGPASDIERLVRLDPTSATLSATWYDNDDSIQGNNQPLAAGEGWLVYSRTEHLLVINSDGDCANLTGTAGLHLVSYHCLPPADDSAFQLLEALGGSGTVSSVQGFDVESGRFFSAGYTSSGRIVGHDFPLIPGKAYLVQMR